MLTLTQPLFLQEPRSWPEWDISFGAFVVVEASPESPVRIGPKSRIGHQVYIGKAVTLHEGVRLDTMSFVGAHSTIGEGSAVHSVKVFEAVTIGRNTFIGGDVSNWTVIGDDVTFMGRIVHTYRKAGGRSDWVGSGPQPSPHIRDKAVVGENAMLIGGIDIGRGAYVAAGEIIKYDVPAGHLAIDGKLIPLSDFRGFIKSRD
jgi:UDP-3-O-[3-hydroxymyristoyl] glucosamine N-acyltransferase